MIRTTTTATTTTMTTIIIIIQNRLTSTYLNLLIIFLIIPLIIVYIFFRTSLQLPDMCVCASSSLPENIFFHFINPNCRQDQIFFFDVFSFNSNFQNESFSRKGNDFFCFFLFFFWFYFETCGSTERKTRMKYPDDFLTTLLLFYNFLKIKTISLEKNQNQVLKSLR